MTIQPFVLDVAVAIAMLIILIYPLWWLYGGPHLLSILAVIVTILAFTVFYPIRYPIASVCISAMLLLLLALWVSELIANRRHQIITQHDSEQLYEQLRDYQLAWVEMFAYESTASSEDKKQVYLFVDNTTYFELIHQQDNSKMRWEFFELAGKPDNEANRHHLIIVLILERSNAPSVALPFNGAIRIKNETRYHGGVIWIMALSHLYTSGAELTLYPFEQQQANDLRTEDKSYLHQHIAAQPHTRLAVPPFTREMLSYLWTEEQIDKAQATITSATTYIIKHDDGNIIQQAIQLSKQK